MLVLQVNLQNKKLDQSLRTNVLLIDMLPLYSCYDKISLSVFL